MNEDFFPVEERFFKKKNPTSTVGKLTDFYKYYLSNVIQTRIWI